jgi:hydrogenase-1 operon protein HyaF
VTEDPLVRSLLSEVLRKLQRLASEGVDGSIDLKTLPMTAPQRQDLAEVLGEGEVTATVEVAGPSRVRETGYDGVWWVEHVGVHGAVLAESLEVARVPEILRAHPADVSAAAARLSAALEAMKGTPR